ncbi:hypothetical protein FDI40_gp595 [Agrobacterium phage Atu_ph07]|uniref:Uncharacterized protein n=1 Tax=Agrobacterium phage Atu_ph07 TaxID=2024264 RepID=A0A2L0V0N3_9CAUD|nr:hypothetical protein FDI40_gp595 [Agrobacterium phage Atu_ph07]AUZ95354.1 hypothetical protein [Agrobacterium phage Atu_ph07]
MKVLIVDPPAGWKYGFPKEYTFVPSSVDLTEVQFEKEREHWFITNGYPEEMIKQGMHRYCRYWEKEM